MAGPNSRTSASETTSPVSDGFAEALELRGGLQNHDRADEDAGEQHDGQRTDADDIHLLQKVIYVNRRSEKSGYGAGGEIGVVLDDQHIALERLDQ